MIFNCTYNYKKLTQSARCKCYYKVADATVQVIIMLTWLLIKVAKKEVPDAFYYTGGTWFSIGMCMHAFIGVDKYKERFEKMALAICFIGGLAAISLICPFVLYILIFVAGAAIPVLVNALPVIILFYTYNCFAEIVYIWRRQLNNIK